MRSSMHDAYPSPSGLCLFTTHLYLQSRTCSPSISTSALYCLKMAQAKSNSGPLMTTTSTTSTQCEYPLSRGDANSKRARKIFLDGRIRALEQVARRCLHVHSGTDVHIEHLEQYSTGDEIETKHSFSVTVLDEQYHFSVKVNAEHGHDIASQVAAMDCIRQQVSDRIKVISASVD